MEKLKLNLGKKKETVGMNNKIWIKKFENGVKIRTKGEGEITLKRSDVLDILVYLKNFCKPIILLSSLDLTYVWQKYPETKEIIEKLLLDELTYEEKMKIHEVYMTKQKILENLE